MSTSLAGAVGDGTFHTEIQICADYHSSRRDGTPGREFKINPFDGDIFRIAMGSSAFLLFLLLMRRLPYISTGIATGIVVLLFRTGLDAAGGAELSFVQSVTSHFSAMVYYIVFAILMHLLRQAGYLPSACARRCCVAY